jgi:hypothetical protein
MLQECQHKVFQGCWFRQTQRVMRKFLSCKKGLEYPSCRLLRQGQRIVNAWEKRSNGDNCLAGDWLYFSHVSFPEKESSTHNASLYPRSTSQEKMMSSENQSSLFDTFTRSSQRNLDYLSTRYSFRADGRKNNLLKVSSLKPWDMRDRHLVEWNYDLWHSVETTFNRRLTSLHEMMGSTNSQSLIR